MRLHAALTDRRFLLTWLLAFGWLLVVRAGHILQSGVWPSPLGTLLGDLAGAFILAVLLTITSGRFRAVLVVMLGAAAYVAGMHLMAHGTLFQLALAGKGMNPTFISGSLLNVYLTLLPVYIAFAWTLHKTHRVLVPQPPRAHTALTTSAVAVVFVYAISFPSLTTPANNVVASAFAQIPGAIVNPVGTAISDEAVDTDESLEARTNFFHQQITSRPNANSPNVLLIMIEGLSGGYLPSISSYHGLEPAVTLEHLESMLTDRGFRLYRNMLSMERQTDRGTFAILCGRYPDFRRPSNKMLDVAEERTNPDCLPSKLRDNGYYTAYWQAAPIAYMKKDKFMPRAGFMDVTGAGHLGNQEEIDGWGPPDPIYFKDVATRLEKLDQETSPWFVTLLNVGTHHPFNIGQKAEQEITNDETETEGDSSEASMVQPQQARRNAMKVMEKSLGDFLEQLETAGTLDNTLIILTSDESGGFVRSDHETLPLNSNLGVLALRPPEQSDLSRYAHQNAITAQLDIPMTILDATGLGDQAGEMIGRSLLALNDRKRRDIMLADTYTGLKYFLRESGQLLACTEMLARCTSWSFNPKRVFGSFQESDKPPFLSLEERLALFEDASAPNHVEEQR
ncbi:LTA synthase family protein [uncultured Marinobacter sp.]|uniref:LTA synthase family protein n=1 Tax=uncultured Marinobacter sp. TaxID=187379 RepID=UPI00263513EB|nr:LTA synthase family protein [uncultured Marinobacter sp.]